MVNSLNPFKICTLLIFVNLGHLHILLKLDHFVTLTLFNRQFFIFFYCRWSLKEFRAFAYICSLDISGQLFVYTGKICRKGEVNMNFLKKFSLKFNWEKPCCVWNLDTYKCAHTQIPRSII